MCPNTVSCPHGPHVAPGVVANPLAKLAKKAAAKTDKDKNKVCFFLEVPTEAEILSALKKHYDYFKSLKPQ